VPHPERVHCLTCGGHVEDVGPISWRGNCVGCAVALHVENTRQMQTGEGPFADRWMRRLTLAMHRRLVAAGHIKE
jgi:prepilin-type processing-associated H-X9-DG protein